MDYLFLFLISTGFVGGIFKGFKRSLKSFLCLVLTFAIFSFIFIALKDFVLGQEIFKKEIVMFVEEKTKAIGNFGQSFASQEELTRSIKDGVLPAFLKTVLLRESGKNEEILKASSLLGGVVYEIVVIAGFAIVLFVLISLVVRLAINIVFVKFKQGKEILITKTFLSGCFGIMKGMLIFLSIEFVFLFVSGYLEITEIQAFVKSSNIGSITHGFVLDQVMLLLS